MRLQRALEAIVNGTAIVLFAIMFALIVVQIVLRSLFNAPLIWSEELARYIFVWVSFLGWVIASRRGSHLGVDIVLQMLPWPGRRLLHGLIAIATLVFAAVMLWTGLAIVARNADVETVTLFFNFAVVYAIVPIAAVLIGFYAVRDLFVAWRGGFVDEPEQAKL
jgi:TRAP-type C4-dicarboxylate transport system permease small subunit